MYKEKKIGWKNFSESLREDTIKIINFEKREIIPFSSKEYESYLNQTNCYIYKKSLKINTELIKIFVN